MYVCVCRAVTDRQIRQATQQGATRLRELRRELGVCGDCGKCGRHALDVLRESLVETRNLSSSAPAAA